MTDKNRMDVTVLKEILNFSCIDLSEAEYPKVVSRVNEVLEMCDEMHELDLAGTPLFEWEEAGPFLRREDLPRGWSGRDSFMEGAPVSDGDFFRVPRILSEEDRAEAQGE